MVKHLRRRTQEALQVQHAVVDAFHGHITSLFVPGETELLAHRFRGPALCKRFLKLFKPLEHGALITLDELVCPVFVSEWSWQHAHTVSSRVNTLDFSRTRSLMLFMTRSKICLKSGARSPRAISISTSSDSSGRALLNPVLTQTALTLSRVTLSRDNSA
jgi:hypothetical protein